METRFWFRNEMGTTAGISACTRVGDSWIGMVSASTRLKTSTSCHSPYTRVPLAGASTVNDLVSLLSS